MHRIVDISLSPATARDPATLHHAAAAVLGCRVEEVTAVRVRQRSVDARRGGVRIRLRVEVWCGEPPPAEDEIPRVEYRQVGNDRSAVIVGAGPAGLFAALRLIELGMRPIVLDRGKDVQARRRDIAAIQKRGDVDPDSNYCFGEGGAGTYSDGKLYTRATKRGDVNAVLRTLVAHGAPADILIESHPHIGSNRLPKVVAALRESILAAGGEIRFQCRVTDLCVTHAARIGGVVTAAGDEILADAVILATGHSARDVLAMLARRGVRLEAKPFAVGVRVEHPQPLIDEIQYNGARPTEVGAASYRLATTVEERGVFSFCMCPGGFIVPAATVGDEVVVNGMSLARRDSPFANSGIVVGVEPADLSAYAAQAALAGIAFQRDLERAASVAGGGRQRAPGQRLLDFIAGRVSPTLPRCSYRPGLTSAAIHELLPAPLVTRLRAGLRRFGQALPGYLSEDAVVVAVESRTSSPVRIPRDPASLQHPERAGLYPCGEGAGYAGGIVSAALDGIRVAEAVAAS